MNKMTLKIKAFAVAALAAVVSVVSAAPASAATYYQLRCGYTNYGIICYYVPTTTTTSSPATTTYTPTTTYKPATTPAPAPAPAPAPTTTTTGLTTSEQQMLNLVNQERAKVGVAPLKADLAITKVARLKSQDMINLNYFSHESPTYGSPFAMMKAFGIVYNTAGENIAGNSSVPAAHTALMNSPGHKANILSPKFTHVGIGIKSGGKYGMMFTQMFVGR